MINIDNLSRLAHINQDIQSQGEEAIQFLQHFLLKKQDKYEYSLEIELKIKLRSYQREGISWMAFLHKYNLNCALCDDMGLGKTIQALCLMANESVLLKKQLKEKKDAIQESEEASLQTHSKCSLVVCPSTLTRNWLIETKKFFHKKDLKATIYEGSLETRKHILTNLTEIDLLISSYEKIRNDIGFLETQNFFYIILDEAHFIKNSKAKITKAIKKLNGERKLILSGTPLQNNVIELWSIFDFLIPGFLGTELEFDKIYNKFLSTCLKKLNEKVEEKSNYRSKLESLKKRMAPLMLRRVKGDVLEELPAKMIQDYACKLTPLQKDLLTELNKKYPLDIPDLESNTPQTKQIKSLSKISYHLKLCSQPQALLKPSILSQQTLDALQTKHKLPSLVLNKTHFCKLLALEQLLHQCGIFTHTDPTPKTTKTTITTKITKITKTSNTAPIITSPLKPSDLASPSPNSHSSSEIKLLSSIIKHKALIFTQTKKSIQIIQDLLLTFYPDVSYLVLHGDVRIPERAQIVDRFNANREQIHLLLLTTRVGGLGLNLTAADVVIFYENDWNPMVDLQAMDRAHRIGQQRIVNVYRFICSGTIEEKIVNLTKFKANLAEALIENKETSSDSLNFQNIFDSFRERDQFKNQNENKEEKKVQSGKNAVISEMESKWDEYDQFKEEF